MLASKLILKLNELVAKHGDLEIAVHHIGLDDYASAIVEVAIGEFQSIWDYEKGKYVESKEKVCKFIMSDESPFAQFPPE